MWDSGYMADNDNLSVINENFNTVKTLLNSIRAQGILNTSDVDKLLSGINTKLEKINTNEDIDLIKVFLTELKQNLDERHSVLVSKFGAIEALFSNLLKNSNELPKSTELKELFDIVATNLSVFSREVVAQKESISDISLKLDALRSDDSQKKDIIKNITLLKPDLERLSNGFDTIVLSLNDNFKTIVKTISSIDNTSHLEKFSDNLNSIEMSSNAVLSALQLLDKKTEAVDDAVKNLVTKSDLDTTEKSLSELKLLNTSLNDSVNEINRHYSKIDNLADKIDASVNIIAGLKSALEDADDKNSQVILDNLGNLETKLEAINDDTKFEDFKTSLTHLLNEIAENEQLLSKNQDTSSENVKSILEILRALDINSNFSSVLSSIESGDKEVKSHIDGKIKEFISLSESNLSNILNNISSNADSLNSKINSTQIEISTLCEGSFNTIFDNIAELKKVVSQIDENSVSSDNAMFSNISDRLNLFENVLKESLETQEHTTSDASSKLCEQVENIKNLSNILDYKMDTSVVEISNMTRTFETLKKSVDGVLALDFVETVKDLRADIYATKQDLTLAVEVSTSGVSESLSNDLYGKYELIISKLDSVEDEFKKIQTESLNYIKDIMEKISSSLVDIISYVSEAKEFPTEEFDRKIEGLSNLIKENNIGYVENIRDIVDIIRAQVENNLKSIEEESSKRIDAINQSLENNTENIRNDIQNSYDKLVEIKKAYDDIRDLVDLNTINNTNSFDKLFNNVNEISSEFDNKLSALKSILLDKITDFKNDLTCDNAEKINEFKFSVESSHSKNIQEVIDLIDAMKVQLDSFAAENTATRTNALDTIYGDFAELKSMVNRFYSEASDVRANALEKIYENFKDISNSIKSISYNLEDNRNSGVDNLLNNINDLKEQLQSYAQENTENGSFTISKLAEFNEEIKNKINKLSDENTAARTGALAKLLDNFVGLKDYVQSLSNSAADELNRKTDEIISCFDSIKATLNKVDENVDGDMTRQLSIIESNFESLISQMTILNEKAEQSVVDRINNEYDNISERIDNNITAKLEEYKSIIETTFSTLSKKAQDQSSYLQERVSEINSVMKSVWDAQSENNFRQIEEISEKLKCILDDNIKLTSVDYNNLRDRLDEFTKDLSANNEFLTQNLKAQLDDMTKYIDSILDIQVQESMSRADDLTKLIETLSNKLYQKSEEVITNISEQAEIAAKASNDLNNVSEHIGVIDNKVEHIKDSIDDKSAQIINLSNDMITSTNELITELSSSIEEKSARLTELSAETSIKTIKEIEELSNKLLEQFELEKQVIQSTKDFISNTMQDNLKLLSSNIEKETDIIVSELVEQFDLFKKAQQDSVIQITTGIESIVENQIYNNIEDLKSYLDIKTDSSVITNKLDNLKIEMTTAFENVVSDMNKMLRGDVFTSGLSDYRVANEILINSAVDRINEKVASFIGDSASELSVLMKDSSNNFENKLALFDKKFIDTVVDKFEEVKLISNKYNQSSNEIKNALDSIFSDFQGVKTDLENRIGHVIEVYNKVSDSTNIEIKHLNDCFENLRTQISNKSFDEAFQASINKQIYSLESLIREQLSYIEDINDLCEVNLPDVAELNTLVKGSVIDSLSELSSKIEEIAASKVFENELNNTNNLISQTSDKLSKQINTISEDTSVNDGLDNLNNLLVETANNLSEQIEAQNFEEYIEDALKETKSDIITQFLNIFNQISFAAEQEEIIDFIQERHDELITILSHIVTSTGEISEVKDGVTLVDNKIDSLKDEISIINEKINNIISAEGDVDYVYSLQDLESDIANLRVVLKEMQDNAVDYSGEFNNLMSSTEGVYKLVESIKDELPDKKSFESLTEDIVSISTRTNKLILASDESYKTLKDNLQDFKLVINDLDERTRNFAQDSGMERIDSKLNALNTMVQNGAKTNQVFNQVFEYLAEWVDNAGNQINAISSKVETLDDIGQIKVMLADLKAESEDNSENVELIEALSEVFDKQAKKISTLETKLDKMIVETTIQNNKLDLKPMEDTLNKFLAAIGTKMSEQQEHINSLESTLEKVCDILDEKDTVQLTKKVGGMDRQIAKLNKSIEKIASHVIEK